MRIYVLDDEVESSEIFSDLNELAPEHDFLMFSNSIDLRNEIDQARLTSYLASEAIFIIDHDLGSYETGLDFVNWLRQNHEFGLMLPVIMLTGRLALTDYTKSQWKNPYLHCDMIITKSEAQSPSFDWSEVLGSLAIQYLRMKVIGAEQAIKRIEQLSRNSSAVGDSLERQ